MNERWFKDTLKAFGDFYKNQQGVWSNVFWYIKVCASWNFIQYTVHWDKTQMLKIFPSDKKKNGTKNGLFFFRKPQLMTVLLLICNSLMSLSTKFISLKLCVEIYVFDSVSFLLKLIFLFNKMHGLFKFKVP